jgi:integrase
MPVPSLRTPSYRRHRPSGQAVVTLDGRDFYLGRFGSESSRAEYDRLIAEWLTHGRRLPRPGSGPGGDFTVNELILAFLLWAETYYRKDGEMTGEVTNIKYAIRPLRQLYGHTPACDFGPLALKAVRQSTIDAGLCRNEVNRPTRILVRLFKWGVENELVPPSVHHGIRAISGLRRGRADVRESEPVKPVPEPFVEAVRPFVARQVWAMVELQRLSGMRPGEVVSMRTIDLDTSGQIWAYTPESHKTEHHGKRRTIYLGPRAQAILRPWLRTDRSACLFSPAQAMAERRAAMRERRKTAVQPSQWSRVKRRPAKAAGNADSVDSYRRAIAYGCQRAAISIWHPHQLRHNAATRLRKEFGLDVARAVLGHSSPAVTELYAQLDESKAIEAMERTG